MFNVHTTFITTSAGIVLCIVDPPGGVESRENRRHIGDYAWSGMSLTAAWQQEAGDVELRCNSTKEWHSGTPEINAIKVGSLHYSF